MKIYNKKNLDYINGMLVAEDGTVVYPGSDVVRQANELERIVQETLYLVEQPKPQPERSLKGFERKSERPSKKSKFFCDTPKLDAKVSEAMELMEELDNVEDTKKANKMLDDFRDLIDFVTASNVLGVETDDVELFDLPLLGNPLEWKDSAVEDAIAAVFGGMAEKED